MPVPAACTGPSREILLYWDKEQHHFEIEIIEGQETLEFFYRNRVTEDLWNKNYNIGNRIDTYEILCKLKHFV
jgi:hypothetical protein